MRGVVPAARCVFVPTNREGDKTLLAALQNEPDAIEY